MEKISAPYDDTAYSKFGNRYLGYVWVIHTDDGEIIDCSSVPSALVGDKAAQYLQLPRRRHTTAISRVCKP